jgi:hypothetical protein
MKMIVSILLTVLVLAVIVFLFTPTFHRWNAIRVNDINQAYQIQNANIRISSYEWFYSMYEEIKATKAKAELAKGTPEEKGIKMVLASMIAEYNAKSKMKNTKAQWKAIDLPYEIE